MIYQIRHRITYGYDVPVLIEPMTIRLRPRSDGAQRLHHWNCRITPIPIARTEILDVFGNAALQVSFAGSHLALTIEADSRVESLRTNAFDFLSLDPRITRLPASYDARIATALWPYLYRVSNEPAIDAWANQLAESVDYQSQPFLLKVTKQISRDYQSEIRHFGSANTPLHTFTTRTGACRDLAVLFMDVCRSKGIAARFVSGYVHDRHRTDHNELHGWAEVYIPGGGWRGYDPSLGVAVADAHIPLATGPEAEWTNPAEGCYFGTGTDSTMTYEVSVTAE